MDRLVREIQKEMQLRILEEGIPRIVKCLEITSEEEIWKWINPEIPSIGNLILHLDGNVRQWFLAGFCNVSYTREREKEFNARKSHTKRELLQKLSVLNNDIELNIYKINLNTLIQENVVQKHFHVSGYGIINHVTEHFSYHVGQIATLTKIFSNQDLGFYENIDL